MAKSSGYITYRDIASGRKPDGTLDTAVVEMLAQENPFLQDIPWRQCGKGREDVTTIRTGMPKATYRAFYEGIVPSKGTKKQVTNTCATVSTALEFDMRLYKAAKDKEAFLADEQRSHMEVMGQALANLIWYGRTKDDPRGINGLFATYSEYAPEGSTDDSEAAFYVINGGHSTVSQSGSKLRSVSIVGWGEKSIHGLYPEGGKMGLDVGQLKEQYVDVTNVDGAAAKLLMGIQEMNQDAGLAIRDFRCGGRICNIDLSRAFDSSGVPDYTEKLRRLLCRVKSNGVTLRMYMCRMMFEVLSVQFARKTQENAVKYADLEQKFDGSLLGVPVSFNDSLNVDEDAVSQAS